MYCLPEGDWYDFYPGEYSWREIRVSRNKSGQWQGTISDAEAGKPDNIAEVTWKFMTEEFREDKSANI